MSNITVNGTTREMTAEEQAEYDAACADIIDIEEQPVAAPHHSFWQRLRAILLKRLW